MKKGKRSTSRKGAARDPKKDALINRLSETLARAGYVVRREELKRGYGWRASSGACRAFDQRFVFVDKRISQEEQIAFLQGRVLAAGLSLSDEGQSPSQEVSGSA